MTQFTNNYDLEERTGKFGEDLKRDSGNQTLAADVSQVSSRKKRGNKETVEGVPGTNYDFPKNNLVAGWKE